MVRKDGSTEPQYYSEDLPKSEFILYDVEQYINQFLGEINQQYFYLANKSIKVQRFFADMLRPVISDLNDISDKMLFSLFISPIFPKLKGVILEKSGMNKLMGFFQKYIYSKILNWTYNLNCQNQISISFEGRYGGGMNFQELLEAYLNFHICFIKQVRNNYPTPWGSAFIIAILTKRVWQCRHILHYFNIKKDLIEKRRQVIFNQYYSVPTTLHIFLGNVLLRKEMTLHYQKINNFYNIILLNRKIPYGLNMTAVLIDFKTNIYPKLIQILQGNQGQFGWNQTAPNITLMQYLNYHLFI